MYDIADVFLTACQLNSMGPCTTEQLKDWDHPYAVRHIGDIGYEDEMNAYGLGDQYKATTLDPGVINEQTGEFLEAWHITVDGPGMSQIDGLPVDSRYSVINDSDHAHKLLEAERRDIGRMVYRPIIERSFMMALPEANGMADLMVKDVFPNGAISTNSKVRVPNLSEVVLSKQDQYGVYDPSDVQNAEAEAEAIMRAMYIDDDEYDPALDF